MSDDSVAQSTLLDIVELTPITEGDVNKSVEMIKAYAEVYKACLSRVEQGEHFAQMVSGLTSNLERKSVEPIAIMHDLDRQGLQHFIGRSTWPCDPLKERQWSEICNEIGIEDGTLIFDGSGTPKKGNNTVGVARQWCGRLGKVDNCVIGVYAAYVGKSDLSALVDSELFIPKQWIEDEARRDAARIPEKTKYKTQPDIAMSMLRRLVDKLPFEWVLADDEFGRRQAFRDLIASKGKRYIVDVPCNTGVMHVRRNGLIKASRPAEALVNSRPDEEWKRFTVRDGEKGPIEVRAIVLPVFTQRKKKETGVKESLVVVETLNGNDRWYCLATGEEDIPLQEFVRRAGMRHRVEEVFQECKGDIGLDHFEVRSWHGWHHHMTISQISHWFLVREKRRLGKKMCRADSQHGSNDRGSTIATAADFCADSASRELSPQTQC